MKSSIALIVIILGLGSTACKKDKTESNFCIHTIHSSPAKTILTQAEMDTIQYLFDRNNLDYSNYLFYSFERDELGDHHVRCYLFVNHLEVFTNDLIFHFNAQDDYYFLSGHPVNTINLDTLSSMQPNWVVAKFVTQVVKDNIYIGNKDDIINGCFELQFGYYDVNTGTSYVPKNFTKAWKVKPVNREYPYAYINDRNSAIIYYDNGIRFEF